MCLLGFISSWLGKAKQQQFGSALFLYSTGNEAEHPSGARPQRLDVGSDTRSPEGESREWHGGSRAWIWAVSDKHPESPPLPALDFTVLLSPKCLSHGQVAIQPQSSRQGSPQTTALITSLRLGPSAEREM